MLSFSHAWVFFLTPLPFLVRRLAPPMGRRESAMRVPFLDRMLRAGAVPVARRSSGARVTHWVVWLFLLGAIARPQWIEDPIERSLPTRDLLLAVDLSASMDQEDFTSTDGHKVNRLQAVKEVLEQFLAKREGDRVGLVVFGNSPFLQVPFTADLHLCSQLLSEVRVGMAGPRTALGDAIGLGIQLFDSSDAPSKTMILLTDGNDTSSQVPPIEAARVARDRDITIHTVAMGDPTTVGEEKLDVEALRGVADATAGGQFFLALDREELDSIYNTLDQLETREVQVVSYRPRQDLYYWPLGAAMILSIVASVLPLARGMTRPRQAAISTRLRVNVQTFELETVNNVDV